jgi:membrane-associated protease RseP (regulator of RpoE activity)
MEGNQKIRNIAKGITLLASIMAFGSLSEGDTSIWPLLIFPVLILLAILVHEVGHALIARHLGCKLLKINVAFVTYDFNLKRFYPDDHAPIGDLGGFVSYDVDEWSMSSRKEFWIAAAGPLFNFALAILVIVLALYFTPIRSGSLEEIRPIVGNPTLISQPLAVLPDISYADLPRKLGFFSKFPSHIQLLISLSVLSIGLGLANLVPFKGSDGKIMLLCWRAMRG